MSAAEIIEQIKSLSPEERQEVVSFIRAVEEESAKTPAVRYMDGRAFEAAAKRVFEQHAELFKKLAE